MSISNRAGGVTLRPVVRTFWPQNVVSVCVTAKDTATYRENLSPCSPHVAKCQQTGPCRSLDKRLLPILASIDTLSIRVEMGGARQNEGQLCDTSTDHITVFSRVRKIKTEQA